MVLESFNSRYGTRRGFIDSKWHQLQFYLGRYNKYAIQWDSVERLVFVCTGNICRSAFAEAVAKSRGVKAISVGIHAKDGASADPQAIIVGNTMGYSLGGHRTQPIMYPEYQSRDLFLAMEPWQATIAHEHLASKHAVTLLGLWGSPVRPYIYDPYMCSDSYFLNCFKYIENTVHAVIEKIQAAN